jgi:hypothetical protein
MKVLHTTEFLGACLRTVPKQVRDPYLTQIMKMSSEKNSVQVARVDRVLVLLEQWSVAFGDKYPLFRKVTS